MINKFPHTLELYGERYRCTTCKRQWAKEPTALCPGAEVVRSYHRPSSFISAPELKRLRLGPVPERPDYVVSGSRHRRPLAVYSLARLEGLMPALRRQVALSRPESEPRCPACLRLPWHRSFIGDVFYCTGCAWTSGHERHELPAEEALQWVFSQNSLIELLRFSPGLEPVLALWHLELQAWLERYEPRRVEAELDAIVEVRPDLVHEFNRNNHPDRMRSLLEYQRENVSRLPRPLLDEAGAIERALGAVQSYLAARDDGFNPFLGGLPSHDDKALLTWFANWHFHRRNYHSGRRIASEVGLGQRLHDWLRLTYWFESANQEARIWLTQRL